MKTCWRCSESLPMTAFYRCASRSDGLQAECKRCQKRRSSAGRATPAERRKRAEDGFAERFWSYVSRGTESECWVWTGHKHRFGYGMISRVGQHSMLTAHRVSWELSVGPIPDGGHVLHKCDNPPCCNPAHLYVGTPADNGRDASARERFGRKLTASLVQSMRAERDHGGATLAALASKYGVTSATVHKIVRREIWRHVA